MMEEPYREDPTATTPEPHVPRVHRSWWMEEALAADPGAPCPPLRDRIEAEVLVVGGGYTGMWTAHHLKERRPDLDVVLVEQDVCGGGPSGRNGGFVNGWWEGLEVWAERFGDADAMEMGLTAARSVAAIPAFCARHGVDAWWTDAPEMAVSTSPFHDGAWRPSIETAERLGVGDVFDELTPEDVRRICDSPTFRGGVLTADTGTVQPARLARGLRRVLLEQGVRIFEGTAVRRLEAGPPAVATTDAGSIRAREVVLGINAWAGTWPRYRRNLAVRGSYIVITEPAPERLAEINWTGGNPIRDLRSSLHYLRTTPDGRIALGAAAISPSSGARIGPAYDHDEAALRLAVRGLHRMFPNFRDVPIAAGWGGPIDVAPLYLPFFHSWESGNVHAALGFTGNGVGPCHLAGHVLAERALHEEGLFSRLAVARYTPPSFPPEPVKSIGMRIVNAAIRRIDDLAEEGKRPGLLTRLLGRAPRLLGYNLGPD